MPVTVLTLAKFARNKPATLLKYELLSEVLRTLTLSWRRPLSYRNQSIDLPSKSMDWFLYETASVMKGLNLDNKKPFFGRSPYLVTASVYIRQVSKRWLKVFVSSTTTKKINMLTMCNVNTEYKKWWCSKDEIILFVSHKNKSLFIFLHVIIFLLLYHHD